MKILVTGADEFVGKHLCRELLSAGHLVKESVHSDYVSLKAAMTSHEPEVVIHAAGLYDTANLVFVNAERTETAATLAAAHGARMVYLSTAEVYADVNDALCYESSTPLQPRSMSALTRLWGEQVCELLAPDRLLILRLEAVYGPGAPRECVPVAIIEEMNGGEVVPPERWGRAWCYVGDAARAIRVVSERGVGACPSNVYNIGRDDIYVSANNLHRVVHLALNGVDNTEDTEGSFRRVSTARMRSLGAMPYAAVGIEEGLRYTYQSMREKVSA
jgi:nucleoside-diphosphate-sugar epimerase